MPNWLCVELASIPSKHPEQSIPSERNEFALHTEQATRGSSCTSPSLTCAEFTPHAEFTSHADLPMCRVHSIGGSLIGSYMLRWDIDVSLLCYAA
jgi:hypothetical protein